MSWPNALKDAFGALNVSKGPFRARDPREVRT